MKKVYLILILFSVIAINRTDNWIPNVNLTDLPVFKQINKNILDIPKMDQNSSNYELKYLKKIIFFKENNDSANSADKSSKDESKESEQSSTIKRFYPRITPYTTAFFVNNRRYYSLSKMSYNYIMQLKYPEFANSTQLHPIELNIGLKLIAIIVVDIILSYKNYDFALGRMYRVLRTLDLNANTPMDTERIATTILVLKNIMDSIKPIIFSNIFYIYNDLNEPNTWNPFFKPRIYQLAVDLKLIESVQAQEEEMLRQQAMEEIIEGKLDPDDDDQEIEKIETENYDDLERNLKDKLDQGNLGNDALISNVNSGKVINNEKDNGNSKLNSKINYEKNPTEVQKNGNEDIDGNKLKEGNENEVNSKEASFHVNDIKIDDVKKNENALTEYANEKDNDNDVNQDNMEVTGSQNFRSTNRFKNINKINDKSRFKTVSTKRKSKSLLGSIIEVQNNKNRIILYKKQKHISKSKERMNRLKIDMYKSQIKYAMQHDKEGKWHKDMFNLQVLKAMGTHKPKYRITHQEFTDLYDQNFRYSKESTQAKYLKAQKDFRFIQTESKNVGLEEEIDFEETFNNNRNYSLLLMVSLIVAVNCFKLLSLMIVAIVMLTIEEKDQQQLISDQMVVDQFVQVFFKLEDSLMDEETMDTFRLVEDCIFYPQVLFQRKVASIEDAYELINPLLSSLQSNMIKNIFVRHAAGLVFGLTRFYFGEMFINYSSFFSQKNIVILCENYGLDAYHKAEEGLLDPDDFNKTNPMLEKAVGKPEGAGGNTNRFKQKTLMQQQSKQLQNNLEMVNTQQQEITTELNKQDLFLNTIVEKINKFYSKINYKKKYTLT